MNLQNTYGMNKSEAIKCKKKKERKIKGTENKILQHEDIETSHLNLL